MHWNQKKTITFVLTVMVFLACLSASMVVIGFRHGEPIKCGLRRLAATKKQCENTLFTVKQANSFAYTVKPIEFEKGNHRTAAVFNINDGYLRIAQNGSTDSNFTGHKKQKVFLPKDQGALIKQVFQYRDQYYSLISQVNGDCSYLSIYETFSGKEILKFPCLPDNNVDFNGTGGGFTIHKNGFLLTIGAPEMFAPKIRSLAQDDNSPYGKVLYFENFPNDISDKVFSKGHRNPQSLNYVDDLLISTEHGPFGGDEINIIFDQSNYGWPLVSYGAHYAKEKLETEREGLEGPIYAFVPSIGISDHKKCPDILSEYYPSSYCIIVSALRGQSLYIVRLSRKTKQLESIEHLPIGTRIREFISGFSSNNSVAIVIDSGDLIEVTFDNFVRP